jgi:hypothetical protein
VLAGAVTSAAVLGWPALQATLSQSMSSGLQRLGAYGPLRIAHGKGLFPLHRVGAALRSSTWA